MTEDKHGGTAAPADPRLAQAVALFEYLARVQQLRLTQVRSTDAYKDPGAVHWVANLPEHPAVHVAGRGDELSLDSPLIVLDRVPKLDPPEPNGCLAPWIAGEVADPTCPPTIRPSITRFPEDSDTEEPIDLHLTDDPPLRQLAEQWIKNWKVWSDREIRDRPAREQYARFYESSVAASTHSEELELVLGVGLLGWRTDDDEPISRHLLTVPVSISFDDKTGELRVELEGVGYALETDMLDPSQMVNPAPISIARDEVSDAAVHPMDREELSSYVRRVIHTLSPDGVFADTDERPKATSTPHATLAPAVILRKRSKHGIYQIFEAIVTQLKEAGEVPTGLLPLVDPNHHTKVPASTDNGAILDVDGDPFLPLPVNDRQLEVIRRVDSSAQVLVQGPPGTGKTHTAAALLSHLLAQGKRVLVTAHTDRALHEVRGKLPPEIRPLSVSVVGSSQSDMADLKTAVERISQNATDFDRDDSQIAEDRIRTKVDQLRRRRASLYARLVTARQQETTKHKRSSSDGTLAAIAQRFEDQAAAFGWIAALATPVVGSTSPLSNDEAVTMWMLLTDQDLSAHEDDARKILPALETLPSVPEFDDACREITRTSSEVASAPALSKHTSLKGIRALDEDSRRTLQTATTEIAREATELERRHERWMNDALSDVRAGRSATWDRRQQEIQALAAEIREPVNAIGPTRQIDLGNLPRGQVGSMARALRVYLDSGKSLKVTAAGAPKAGAFTPGVVKQSMPLLTSVTVDGVPPTTVAALAHVELAVQVENALDALDRAWPSSVAIPDEDTYGERLQWHVTESALLRRLLSLAGRLAGEASRHEQLGVQSPDWTDLSSIITFASLVDVAAVHDQQDLAALKLDDLATKLHRETSTGEAPEPVALLAEAVRLRDVDLYGEALARIYKLHEVRRLANNRDEDFSTVLSAAPDLAKFIEVTAKDEEWASRLSDLEGAWAWAETARWIRSQESDDVNLLQAQLTDVERQLRGCAGNLAATLAWRHAVSPSRMTGRTRADLTHYSQLVKRLGKGTGKYAPKQRAEIRIAMDRCRTAVPVWIMPLFRVAEQLSVSQDMFDVVIIDEASQAGLEATFLQHIAPRIVVIGDDKQVSPAGVGIDQMQLRDLAQQFIPNDRYREQWINPQRSYFDEATMRFPRRTVLTEHRRCMPEIIGFSNRVAYEPEGVRLDPVRQYGADRLEPIKTLYVPDGYEQSKINRPEAERIVETIEKCVTDHAYDGKTFGVISLLGAHQAKAIERMLLERLGPDEIVARDLRCGDATDFQGSERDVVFLSMVSAPEPGRRLTALTRTDAMQRFNVAASRARDQMWLFHSMTPADLSGRPDDMRTALLEYCRGIEARASTPQGIGSFGSVSEDLPVDPFDSLFEQRVYNRILDRGFTVLPQVEALGYRIDLVIVGANGRLAVECDGDQWHGPAQFENDLRRQRELERCGWRFFRIRESHFYLDRAAAMRELWERLDELEIRPSGWAPPIDEDPANHTRSVPGRPATPEPDLNVDGSSELADNTEREPKSLLNSPDDAIEPADHLRAPAAGQAAHSVTLSREQDPPLISYPAFEGVLTPVGEATPRELVDGLVQIVDVEGPVLGHRLHRAYVTASGGQRVGRLIGQEINRALSQAVRSGRLISEDLLHEGGLRPRTFRTPEQPPHQIRSLGPRSLELVPPAELAALISEVSPSADGSTEELFRAVLARLGLTRLTSGVETRLNAALALLAEVNQPTVD